MDGRAFLNSAIAFGGMGPVNPPKTDAGKLFAGIYALYAGLVFIGTAASGVHANRASCHPSLSLEREALGGFETRCGLARRPVQSIIRLAGWAPSPRRFPPVSNNLSPR